VTGLGGRGTAVVAERAARSDVTVLVNSAGINGYGPFLNAEPLVSADAIALNVTALTLLCRAAITGMAARSTGAIINVSSLLAFSGGRAPDPLPARATYVETEAYVVALTRTLAAEPEASGINLQVLCPGRTATEFHAQQGSAPVSDAGGPPDPGEMSAADVARASLTGMDNTEILVVPGLEDPAALDRLAEAEGLLSAGNKPTLARRYTA
jgi:short-subunit dehydrogenase